MGALFQNDALQNYFLDYFHDEKGALFNAV